MPDQNGHRQSAVMPAIFLHHADAKLLGLACAGMVITFAVDLMTPLGIALPMIYVAFVLLGLWSDHRWVPMSLAVSGGLLTIVGYLLSPSGDATLGVINRTLAILVMAVTAYLVMATQQARLELRTLRRFLSMCASCRKIRDDQGAWSGLEQYLENRMDLLFSHSMCPVCMEKWYPEMYPELQVRHPELFQGQPN